MNKLISKGILALGALLTLSLAGTTARADNFLIVPVGSFNSSTCRAWHCEHGFGAQTKGSANSWFRFRGL